MKKINYINIYQFKDWNKVFDYDSDESSVILYDQQHKILAEFGYGGFTEQDLKNFKK